MVVTSVGVASAVFSWIRVRRLAELPIRHLWLVWLALVVQVVVFGFLGHRIPLTVSGKIHLGTYALALAFLWLNRRLPGGRLISIGTASNLAAVVANNGAMPANMSAWRKAGLPEIPPEVFTNSRALSSPRLAILGDIFYVPASWPLSNVFSIGDVLIVIGSTYLAHRWCSQPRGRELASVIDQCKDTSEHAHELV
ncbi:MAG TPA: DUF5317 domain-containing protein [Ilumatobacteraceae bacterium]|nr:DUF5317 domain-containing protein [Ilumatobacteraceae bacterium]